MAWQTTGCKSSQKEAAQLIAEEVGADVVQVIGTRFVLYRESVDHKKIDLSLVK
jgi:RNA-binding protein